MNSQETMPPHPHPHPDAIADCVLAAFHALPSKCKPRRNEWVPLAGVVVCRDRELSCVSLATGMKCLPREKLARARGNVLHDWHAEILALRGLGRAVVDECMELVEREKRRKEREGQEEEAEGWIRWSRRRRQNTGTSGENEEPNNPKDNDQHHPPFELTPNTTLHIYVSSPPCGDASMELTIASQPSPDPWTTLPPPGTLPGRGNFDLLGIVRRKPARPDAPPTGSKSCSDKLAMKQCTGLLSSVVGPLVRGTGGWCLDTLVLPQTSVVDGAVERAFGPRGRMAGLAGEEVQARWKSEGGYAFRPFRVEGTGRVFEFSKEAAGEEEGVVGSNLSVLWTARRTEVLINGVLQGRKQFDPRGASCVCRRRMWEGVVGVLEAVGMSDGLRDVGYAEFKARMGRVGREKVKREVRELALKGWQRNLGDEEWRLEG